MNLTALEILIDVVRKGSLSGVARERRITPSTVSRTIAGLEAELGVRLLQRSTRRLAPTEAALQLIEGAQGHVEALRRAQEQAAESADELRGTLRVTASTSFGVSRLSPLIAEFGSKHPQLRIELHLTDAIVDLIAQRFDVAIRHGALRDSSLIAQALLKPRYFVCASPSYLRRHRPPREPRDLAAHRCLVFPTPGVSSTWRFRRKGGVAQSVSVEGAIVVNSGLALRQCALDGAGLVMLSDWLVSEDLRTGRLVDVFPGMTVTPTDFHAVISAVYPSREHAPRKVRVFIDFLKRKLRK